MKVTLGSKLVQKRKNQKFIVTVFNMQGKQYYMLVSITEGIRWDDPKEYPGSNQIDDPELDEDFILHSYL